MIYFVAFQGYLFYSAAACLPGISVTHKILLKCSIRRRKEKNKKKKEEETEQELGVRNISRRRNKDINKKNVREREYIKETYI